MLVLAHERLRVQPLEPVQDEQAVLAHEHTVEPDLATTVFRHHHEHQIPVDRRAVPVRRRIVGVPDGHVNGPTDLLVEERIEHRSGDVRIHAERKLAHEAPSIIDVDDLVERRRHNTRRGLDDLAVSELQRDVAEHLPFVQRRSVEADLSADRIPNRRRVDLTIWDIVLTSALDDRDIRDREAQLRPRRHETHTIRPLHQRDERIHRHGHTSIVHGAHFEVEVLKPLLRHFGERRQGIIRVTNHNPFRVLGTPLDVNRPLEVLRMPRHVLWWHIGQIERVVATPDRNEGSGQLHDLQVQLTMCYHLCLGRLHEQIALERFVVVEPERHSPHGRGLTDQLTK